MANLTIDPTQVRPVEILERVTYPAGVDVDAGEFVVPSANKWALGDASTAAGVRNGAVALRTAKTNHAITGLRKGWVFLGDALNALSVGAPVYASDDAGFLADAAGTVSHVIGYVDIIPNDPTSPSKCLRVDL